MVFTEFFDAHICVNTAVDCLVDIRPMGVLIQVRVHHIAAIRNLRNKQWQWGLFRGAHSIKKDTLLQYVFFLHLEIYIVLI